MQDLLNYLQEAGFSLDRVQLDGKMHRFDRGGKKKNAWLIGWQHHLTKTGEPFTVAEFGDWVTGETHQFKTQRPYSKEDKYVIEKRLKETAEKAEKERLLIQKEVARDAIDAWETFRPDGTHAYLEKKQLSGNGLYGARVSVSDGFALAVPMRDSGGVLWGYQKINNDGSKYFMPGQRILGCYHTIGEIDEKKDDTIYICEGFATGATVAAATQKPVVCAFNTANLEPVCKVIRAKYPDAGIIVCGDDDRFQDDGKNPGREKAENAARAVLGTTVFPEFKSLKEKPTDFNDLHVLEGIESVKSQIVGVETEKHFIVSLGYDKEAYYYISNINRQIQALGAGSHNASGLCRIQPKRYWEALYPGFKGGVRWADAASDLMEQCHRRGIFRPERLRGPGVWIDDSRVVYHMGDRIHYLGEEHDLHKNKLRSKFIYELDEAARVKVHPMPLNIVQCQDLLDASALVKWKRPEHQMLFAGWLAIAPVCGALPWRPHIWLTGPSGSGKSYLMQSMIYPLLSGLSHYFQGNTTEAGIRQKSGNSTKPIIFDEFETNDERSGDRVKMILELARQASSESDAIVAKGTSSGLAMEFKPRFSMLVSSVRVNLIHEEDKNRFACLDLARAGDDRVDHFEQLKKFVAKMTPDYGHRLFSRSLGMMYIILENSKVFQSVLGEQFTMRFGQQYGTLLAGYQSLISDGPVTRLEAEQLVAAMDLKEQNATPADEQDELLCLAHLLETPMTIEKDGSRIDRTLIEMVATAKDIYGSYSDQLQRLGIMIEGGHLILANNYKPIQTIFSRTKWAGSYSKPLSRIPGAVGNKAKWFPIHSKSYKTTWIPLSLIFSKQS